MRSFYIQRIQELQKEQRLQLDKQQKAIEAAEKAATELKKQLLEKMNAAQATAQRCELLEEQRAFDEEIQEIDMHNEAQMKSYRSEMETCELLATERYHKTVTITNKNSYKYLL